MIIRDLLYADDLQCLGSSFHDLERARRMVEEWCEAWRMFTNASPGKSEYVLFFQRLLQGEMLGWMPPLPPGTLPQVARPPVQYPGLPDMRAADSYKLLGVILDKHLDLKPHFESSYQSMLRKVNFLVHHKSNTINMMGPGRQMGIVETYTQTYAWSVLTPPKEAMAAGTKFRATVAAKILRLAARSTSRLLLATISGLPSVTARLLKERLRFLLQMRAHSLRLAPHVPWHVSLSFFDRLLLEHSQLGYANPLPNWITDLQRLIDGLAHPIHPLIRDLSVAHSFEATPAIRSYVAGISYFEARREYRQEIHPQHLRLGPEPPTLHGSTQAALSLTFGLSAPAALFDFRARPVPFSTLGPGLGCPVMLAAHKRFQAVLRAQSGALALHLEPWATPPPRKRKESKAARGRRGDAPLTPAAFTAHATADELPQNWNDAAPCPLCQHTDSVFHVVSCGHPRMAGALDALFADARDKLIPALIAGLRTAIARPADGREPINPALTPDEERALLERAQLRGAAPRSNEATHVMYRLLIAGPWPRRVAQSGHHLASAMGALFDAVIASRHDLRAVCALWLNWAERSIHLLAKARRRALADEALSPTLPLPPPWPGHRRPLPSPTAAARAWTPGPIPGLPPPAFPAAGAPDSFVSNAWYRRCNLAALRHLLLAALAAPTLRDAATAALAAPGIRTRKRWHCRALAHILLRHRDLAAFPAPSAPLATDQLPPHGATVLPPVGGTALCHTA